MRYFSSSVFCILIVCFSPALAWDQTPEVFDLSGIPTPPTSFVEQQILEMVAGHKNGDLSDAARIQQKLATYYREKRDQRRSEIAEARAKAASSSPDGSASTRSYGEVAAPRYGRVSPVRNPDGEPGREAARPAPSRASTSRDSETPPSGQSAFSGRYYGYEGRSLHTWDFNSDGTFLHTLIAAGVGASARSSEKGTFRIVDQYLELTLASSATAFATPTVGGRGTLIGGGADSKAEIRRLKIEFQGPGQGIVLDGISMKVKSW